MASNERKIQAYMTREQTAEYFRALARTLEGESAEAMVPELEDFKKFKLTLAPEGDRYSLKCTVKHPKAAAVAGSEFAAREKPAPAAEGGLPKYEKLKKRMKSDFKLIQETVRQGSLPDANTASSFTADCELMVRYPGKGDPFYDLFAKATREFSHAYAQGDVDALAGVCDKMEELKTECHDRYK